MKTILQKGDCILLQRSCCNRLLKIYYKNVTNCLTCTAMTCTAITRTIENFQTELQKMISFLPKEKLKTLYLVGKNL